jgi:hypothetical protein
LNAGGSSWNVISDRNRKRDFVAVDGEDMLARIRTLPVSTRRYVGEEDRSALHIGPMAPDWQRAFGFSSDATPINMSDLGGVNLAGVQALDARTAAQDTRIAAPGHPHRNAGARERRAARAAGCARGDAPGAGRPGAEALTFPAQPR